MVHFIGDPLQRIYSMMGDKAFCGKVCFYTRACALPLKD